MIVEQYIYKKVVDWSALNYGINIPVSLQPLFYDSTHFHMRKGETKRIRILIDSLEYEASLTNIKFDERKYPNHKDLLQIRYTRTSPIAKRLKEIFCTSYNWFSHEKAMLENSRQQLCVPENKREFIALYTTSREDVVLFECLTNNEIFIAKQSLCAFDEMEVEMLMSMNDDSASIVDKSKIVKIRKVDKTICDSLKRLYEFRCQICGEFIGKKYDATVIHSHHIQPFSQSLNNNPRNIMIICPNHHGIVHSAHPTFSKDDLAFTYPNGYVEKLKLNIHL